MMKHWMTEEQRQEVIEAVEEAISNGNCNLEGMLAGIEQLGRLSVDGIRPEHVRSHVQFLTHMMHRLSAKRDKQSSE